PVEVPGGPTAEEIARAQQLQSKSVLDVVLEAGGQILMEVLGINDVLNCLKGDLGACVMAVVGALPWGKIFKAKKIAEAIFRAGKAVITFFKELEWARAILRGAEKAAEAAKAAAAAAAKAAAEKAAKAKAAAEAAAKRAAAAAAARAKALASKAKAKTKKSADDADNRPGCRNSFVAGTRVLLADGRTQSIEEIQPGDTVIATEPETGKTERRQVTRTIRTDDDKTFVDLTIRDRRDANRPDRDNRKQTITTTDHHKFWSATRHQWVHAGDLKVGELLRTSAGTHVQIGATKRYHATHRTYDLTVDTTHTYYVAVGRTSALVHNCDDDLLFAHGTTGAHADNIDGIGLDSDAAAAASHGGKLSRPGSLSTHQITGPGDTENLSAAAQWATDRNNGVRSGAAVMVFSMCRCTYNRLVREGHIMERGIGEGIPPEIVFGPGALQHLTRVARIDL
ncbi:MAG TPA: polymorphic toxin-type HINT domain-containing protein, partial [Pilimelia sp.]|nr:polymorphic toxin-type HINT domain-containing protein [Pilimelia sp.]